MIDTGSNPLRAAACGLIVAAMLAGPMSAARADDAAAQLRAAALAEEGELLLEETAGLEPIRQRDRAEAERLSAADKQLAAEVAQIEKQISAYNRAVAELGAAAAEHASACPPDVAQSAVDECNARGERLMVQAGELDRTFTALQARQGDINARVDAHNRARDAWQAARRENAPRLDANAADTQRWVTSAQGFMAGADFAALSRRAGQPTACAKLRLSGVGVYFGEQGLRQLQACLKATLRAL
jgi:chromosome segregation ATPase